MNGIKKSILAGILIGLAVINNLQSKDPVIGALLFSFGLLTIIQMQSSLYTGKIGYKRFMENSLENADTIMPLYLRKSQAERMKK